MYDPDPPSCVLRLDTPRKAKPPKPLSSSELLAIAERQMEEAIARWVEADMVWRSERLQAQPISAVRQPVGDGAVRYERQTF